jgi:hypothetical protein
MFSYHDERSILSLYQPMIGFYIEKNLIMTIDALILTTDNRQL